MVPAHSAACERGCVEMVNVRATTQSAPRPSRFTASYYR